MNRRAGIVLAAILVVLLPISLIASCGGPEARSLPPPSSTSSTEPTATAPDADFSRIALEPIPGQTTTTVPMSEGSATIRGSVQGPDGPVPNAIVRAERLVGDAVQRIDVRSGDDGTYAIAGVPGGRFRVRAFSPPTLAMDSAEVFFLEDGAERELRLVVEAFSGLSARAGVTPGAPVVGQDVNLAVRVSELQVDDDGVAREVPRPDVRVRVTASGWTRADRPADDREEIDEDDDDDADDNVLRTDADGIALFPFRCERATSVTVTAFVGDDETAFPLEAPPCRPVPTTTTTASTTTSTTAPADDEPA